MLEAEKAVEDSIDAINSGADPLGTQVAKILSEEAEISGSLTDK
jgi:hypothetical protein